jgi:teichuronic acid biosynthesis glycosyltransferase TuaG
VSWNDEALVSIIVPAYNAEKHIEQTIRSVKAQSYYQWELLVVDDGSRDNTRKIVRHYAKGDSRIRLLVLKKNSGAPAVPRNFGVKAARGEWVALLDADDIWHPKKLELQMGALKASGAVFCSTQMLDFVDEKSIHFSEPENPEIMTISFFKQLRRFRTPTSSVMLKRTLLLNFQFNEDPRYKAREDLDCWLRIHEHIGKSIKLLCPLLYYRIVRGQISGAKWRMVKRTFMVLDEFRLRSGDPLGWKKYLYFMTHYLYSIYYRVIRSCL